MTRLWEKADSIFLDPQMFRSLLNKELARAERYNQHVSILLLTLEGVPRQEQAFWRERLARLLAEQGAQIRLFWGF